MKSWLADLARMGWAFFYWNARKSAYVIRGRSGPCPCHNPSDSGEPMATECEAVVSWHRPERFQRVCPLLAQGARGRWVCRVRAAEVRPFWGRAFGYLGGTLAVLALAAGLGVFVFFRAVGYDVTLRQVFWPRAWSEQAGVRARLFNRQARAYYTAGRTREALAAWETALQLEPDNYEAGLMLAQLYQAGNAAAGDQLYARLLTRHPEHRPEISRGWFRSLLGRGRLAEVAGLARAQLSAEPAQTAVWANALIYSAQRLAAPELLETAAGDAGISPAARDVLRLAAQVARAPNAAARRALLVQTPLTANFPYDRAYRAEQLIKEGFFPDALSLLAASTEQLGGRDVARFVLAAYAARGDRTRLAHEFDALLAPGRPVSGAELSLLALHLVRYPDPDLLAQMTGAIDRIETDTMEARVDAYLTIYCAAGVQRNAAGMHLAAKALATATASSANALNQLEAFFLSSPTDGKYPGSLPPLNPFSLECSYAILDRYLKS